MSAFVMEEYTKEDEPRSVLYSQSSASRYPGGREDGLGDGWQSTIDLTANGWATNPLAGPSTHRSEAIEARALKMIAASTAPGIKNMRQGAENLSQNVQKRLNTLLNSINRASNRRQGKGIGDLKNRDGGEAHSDDSLVLVTIKSKASFCTASSATQDTQDELPRHFSAPGRQQKSTEVEIASEVITPNPSEAQFCFKGDMDVLATRQGAMSPKTPKSATSNRHTVPDDELGEHHTKVLNNAQKQCGNLAVHLIPDDDISVLELPPALLRLYEQSEYQKWSLNSGLLTPEPNLEASSISLTGSLILEKVAPSSPSLGSSQDLTNDWRYVEEEDDILGVASPPASLLAEDTNSLMEEPEDLGYVQQNSRHSSPENSAVLSGSEFSASECSIPAIYPGMEQHPPPFSCASEVNENWSNTSYSLLDTVPQYHHRVVSTPVCLRGGGKDVPKRFNAWRLFLGDMPVGDVEKGKKLLDSPLRTMDNFLLGRRGKPKTGRELCEETEKRIERGKEIQRRKDEKKKAKREGK